MGVFYQEELGNPSRRCKFLTATLKDVFSNCHTCGRLSTSSPQEDNLTFDHVDDEQEVVVSEIRSRAMEKLKHRPFVITDSFTWVYSPKTGELFVTPKALVPPQKLNDDDDVNDSNNNGNENEERDEFLSVGSCFSCCSSGLNREAFLSARSIFSRCSSFNGFEFLDFPRQSILHQFCHCEGWPFGLCRKAVLLPPLPKSPSESWSWRKGNRTVRMA